MKHDVIISSEKLKALRDGLERALGSMTEMAEVLEEEGMLNSAKTIRDEIDVIRKATA